MDVCRWVGGWANRQREDGILGVLVHSAPAECLGCCLAIGEKPLEATDAACCKIACRRRSVLPRGGGAYIPVRDNLTPSKSTQQQLSSSTTCGLERTPQPKTFLYNVLVSLSDKSSGPTAIVGLPLIPTLSVAKSPGMCGGSVWYSVPRVPILKYHRKPFSVPHP